jgi:hypothetical protein
MRFKKEYGYTFLGTVFARGRRVIGWYVNRRAVEWGEAGQDITILDLTLEYLGADMPQEYKDSGFDDVGLLVDGKDNNCDTIRKDSSLSRAQYSSKKSCSAIRTMSYQTPAGLSVEHTPAYWGRSTETALEQLWGSCNTNTPRFQRDSEGNVPAMLPLHKTVDRSSNSTRDTNKDRKSCRASHRAGNNHTLHSLHTHLYRIHYWQTLS